MSESVRCTRCGREFPVGRQVEASERSNWTCPQCAEKEISLDLLDFIQQRIKVTRAEYENHGRFVLRELVQNADDAGASIIVLRFEQDALYAANDGRAFTTTDVNGRLSDFAAISAILKRSKAEDKEMTGHFGSGFQTVYAITNAPEVHSSGRSGRMNPVDKEWTYFDMAHPGCLVSPYVWRRDDQSRGVLFKFPWRDAAAAEDEFGRGKRPFSNPDDWPRWDAKAIRRMYEDLRDYIHPLLLCCNRLRTIRLVWAAHGVLEAYQVERDYSLEVPKPVPYVGTVKEGHGDLGKAWYAWDERSADHAASGWKSLQTESWQWKGKGIDYRYLVRSGLVSDDRGNALYIGRRPDNSIHITYHKEELKRELKRNDVHLLLPLFDSAKAFRGDGRAFLYSVIPLPKRGGNRFVFSGHFFPTEDRMDVSVSSLGGKDGEWHQKIVLSVGRLYRESLATFVQKLHQESGLDANGRQAIIMNTVPGVALHEWMRPGKDLELSQWADRVYHEIMVSILRLEILHKDGAWAQPAQAYWPRQSDGGVDDTGARLIRMMGCVSFTPEFVGHPHFRATLERSLSNRELDATTFLALFQSFLRSSAGRLFYGVSSKGTRTLRREEVGALIQYCITRQGAWNETKGLPVVPGKDGVLRALADYRSVPSEFAPLQSLLQSSMKINDDFEDLLKDVERDARTVRPEEVVQLVSRIANENPDRFVSLNDEDHESISRLLVALARHPDFGLKDAHVGLRFIPYRESGRVRLGSPNTDSANDGRRTVFDARAERYRRDFIFMAPGSKVPGLTEEVRSRIRFLDLKDSSEGDLGEVGRMLHLVGLQEGSVPTNYVRHFLSDRHKSLFRDDVLGAFLGKTDKKLLDTQKRAFLEAFRAYYDPDDLQVIKDSGRFGKTEEFLRPNQIGQIPCLYDSERVWDKPANFAIELTQELEVLGYRALHRELRDWNPKTIEGLGVERRPQAARIVEKVQQLMKDSRKHRRILADIVCLVLTSTEPWSDGLRELEHVAWIPSADGGYGIPREILVPSSENASLLGNQFGRLFDASACSADYARRFEKVGTTIKSERAKELGLALEPTIEMLLNHVGQLARRNKTPASDLFRRLAERVRPGSGPPPSPGWYFYEGKWWDVRRVVLSEDEELRRAMGDRYLFIKEAHLASEELYLRYAGAGDSVNSEDILERMAELSKPLLGGKTVPDEWLRVLWDRLEPMSRTVEGEQAARYRSLITYPVNGGHVRPMRIVLLAGQNQQIFPSGGWYGQWYALPETLSHHRATLRALGAKSSDQLSAKEIREIIESVCADGKPMSPTAADTVVRLLLVLGKLSPYRDIANAAIWPAVSKGTVSLRRLDECLIRDHPAAAQFENEVSLLYDPSDWKLRADFRWLAVACGGSSRLFSQAVQTEYSHSTAQVPDDGLAARLRLMADAIRSAFPGACVAAPESINWLRKISVFRSDRLELRVRVGRIERRVETPCVIIPEDGKSKILRVGFDPSLRDSLASALVDELERQGFPVDSESGVDTASRVTRSELGLLIYRLLTRDPSEWHFFVRDLEPIREWVPPILDEEAETRQGYAEVRQSLLELYGCCQICGRRTPAAEGARDSCETVRSIVSMKGGRYPGYFDEYVLGNSLFLCPSHQTLYVRRLVKLPDLDKARAMGREGAQRLRTMAKLIDTPDIQVDVYETPEAGNFPPRWQSRTLSLKSEHGREIMNWLADWVERVANERT